VNPARPRRGGGYACGAGSGRGTFCSLSWPRTGLTDHDVPELLTSPLEQRFRDDLHPSAGRRPEKIGAVVDAHGDLATVGHGEPGPRAPGGLDDAGVDATVNGPPRREVVLAQVRMALERRGGDLVDDESGHSDEPARLGGRGIGKSVGTGHGSFLPATGDYSPADLTGWRRIVRSLAGSVLRASER
jgi:hypothetical protein